MQDVYQTIISQYANSPRLVGLIDAFNAELDPGPLIDNFFDNVWNILWGTTPLGSGTADYGLDLWGRILVLPRVVDTIILPDNVYQTVLIAKAMKLISNSSIASINKILLQLFGPSSPIPVVGNAYCTDDGNMAMTVTIGPPATFNGASISLNTLTVPSDPLAGRTIRIGQQINGFGVAANTVVLTQLSGSPGLAGTYQVSVTQAVGVETMTSNSPLSATQTAILNYADVIPKPCGVALTVVS